MTVLRSLPVIMPKVAGQRWSCHSCGDCCRTLVGRISDEERKQIDRQGWAEKLGVAPYVRLGREWALNKRADGACVFLDADNRCMIHSEYGEQSKPLACRVFPFSLRPTTGGWQATLRFDCPSVTSSCGKPIEQHRSWLTDLAQKLDHHPQPAEGAVDLKGGVRATPEELEVVVRRFLRWIVNKEQPMPERLVGAARVTTILADSTLEKVRGRRFAELLELLFASQASGSARPADPPTRRQLGMLRQLAFAHSEHVSLEEIRSGTWGRVRKRWGQLRRAKRFLKGRGVIPALVGFEGSASFDAVDRVAPAVERAQDIDDLLRRYLCARLAGRSTFGAGYYGWPVVTGLAALWLSVSAAGWLARYVAATGGRMRLSFDDVARAVGVIDRAATRLPALGTVAERTRVSYLLSDDGLARLLGAYWFCGVPL